jgi:hypothetical protein
VTSILFKEAEHRATVQYQLLLAVTEQLTEVHALLLVAEDFILFVRQRLSSSLMFGLTMTSNGGLFDLLSGPATRLCGGLRGTLD